MAAINLNIVTAERPPFVFKSSRTDGNGIWFGYLVELIPLLFQYANLNVTLKYYEAPTNEGGSLLPNGSWSGVTGELMAGRADIAAFPLVQAPGRPSVIDLTYSYYESGLGVLVQKEIASTPGTDLFLKPFTPALWLALIATVLGMAVVYHLLSWASPLGEFEVVKVRNVTTNAAVEEFSIDLENESFLLDALMAAMTICAVPRGKSWSIRIPSIAYYFFTMIIVASYTANFASYLTVQSFKYPVNSIEELAARDKLNYVINAGGATESYFKNSIDPTILALRPRLRTVIGNTDGVQAVRDGKYTAYLAETPTLQYFSGQEPCDLQVVGAPFGPSVYTLGVRKNGPYTRAINRAMLQLKQNGLLDELKKKWVDDQNVCTAQNSVTNSSLRVKDFSGLWYLLIGVLAFGFLWAIGEVILVNTLAANPALREAFIRMTHHVTNAGKRLDLLSRLSSRNAPQEAAVTDYPACVPDFEPQLEKSASERNRAFDVFDVAEKDVAEKDEELGNEVESEAREVDPNKEGLVVLTYSN